MRNKMRSSGEKLTVNNYYKDRTKPIPGFGGGGGKIHFIL
jgi:hypothetical protein